MIDFKHELYVGKRIKKFKTLTFVCIYPTDDYQEIAIAKIPWTERRFSDLRVDTPVDINTWSRKYQYHTDLGCLALFH